MSDFQFTQQEMAEAIRGFGECDAALRANINALQNEYQNAIAQGMAGKNVAALVNLYENGIRPTCLDIAKNLGVMSEQLHAAQNQYNTGFDDEASRSLNKLLPGTGGGGPLSRALAS